MILLNVCLRADLTTYVNDYHYIWYDTCVTYKNDVKDQDFIVSQIGDYTCNGVYIYSFMLYSHIAIECYQDGTNMFDCLGKTNVFFNYLGVI